MSDIKVKLFGNRVILNNGQSVTFPFKKAEALFYYLIVNNSASRDELVNLLWGGTDEENAKKNLRNAVYIIKRLLGEDFIISPQRSIVMLNPSVKTQIDLNEFNSDDEKLSVSSYSGEFLEGFLVKDADAFDNWALNKRTYYKNLYIKKLYLLMNKCLKENKISRAIRYGELIISNDNLEEKAYRTLMKLYCCQNSSNKAIDIYNNFKETLKNELGVVPDSKTTFLYNQIMNKQRANVSCTTKEYNEFFYGRKPELETLQQSFDIFFKGALSKSHIIIGEAGIGKTKLKERFLFTVEDNDLFLVETSCYQAEQSYMLKPWNTFFSKLSDIIEKEKIAIPSSLGSIIRLVFPTFLSGLYHIDSVEAKNIDSLNFQSVEEAVIGLLNKICQHKKMVLVFEDIHWIDDRSLSLLKSILLSKNKNLILVATCRNEFTRQLDDFICSLVKYDLLQKIVLQRFNKAEVSEILCSALPGFEITEELYNKAFKETEGNTFFIIELINNIIENKEMSMLSSKAHDILKTRFLNLSHEHKNVLDILSVFIEKGSFNTIKSISEINEYELMDILDELKDRYLIKEDDGQKDIVFEFTHQKLKEFVYSGLSLSRRKLLHYKIASFLESQLKNDYSDLMLYSKLIFHFTNAGRNIEALKYSVINADCYLQSAQELFPILVDTAEEDNRYSFINHEEAVKFLSEIESILEKVKQENGTNQEIAKLEVSYLLMKARYHIKYGEYDEGVDIVKKMIRYAIFYHDYKNALKGYKLMIYFCIQTFNNSEMEECIEKSLIIAGEQSFMEDEGTLLRFKGLLNIFKGDYKQAEYFLRQSVQVFEMLNMTGGRYILSIAAAYNYLGEIRRQNRCFKEAIEYYNTAINMCEKNKILRGLATFNKNAGQAAYQLGDYSGAWNYLSKAAGISEELDSIWGRSTINAYLSLVLIRQEKYKESLERLIQAEKDSKVLKIPYEIGVLYWVKAEIKRSMETDPTLQGIFDSCLTADLSSYCSNGIKILSTLKGTYEIDYLKALL